MWPPMCHSLRRTRGGPLSANVPHWLVMLARMLNARGAPARDLVAGGGRLEIDFGPAGDAELVATVRPLRPRAQGWAATRHFVIGYQGSSELKSPNRRRLQALLDVLRRLETHVPAGLDVPCALFSHQPTAEVRFLRLFPFCTVERSRQGSVETTEVLIRATTLCNESCPFCSAPMQEAEPTEATLRACMEQAHSSFPGGILTLTGGEPTLRPAFMEELACALAGSGCSQIQVQTNALSFAQRLDAAAIPPSHRLFFFASMHALDESIYEACTGTKGTFGQACAGLQALLAAGHSLVINCVVNRLNLDHLPQYVRVLSGMLGPDSRAELHFSSLICSERRPQAPMYLVRYRDLAPAVEQAATLAHELGIRVSSLRSSTYASLPACTLTRVRREDSPRRLVLPAHETGYEQSGRRWVKSECCRVCRETDSCLGVPSAYARQFGLAELKPITGD
jgi:pyruvate-formate lyase-activating enzyme